MIAQLFSIYCPRPASSSNAAISGVLKSGPHIRPLRLVFYLKILVPSSFGDRVTLLGDEALLGHHRVAQAWPDGNLASHIPGPTTPEICSVRPFMKYGGDRSVTVPWQRLQPLLSPARGLRCT